MSVGVQSITFFSAGEGTYSYLDGSGKFVYERDRDGAEFLFNVELNRDRIINIRVVVFGKNRSLDELEKDAYLQPRRALQRLGKIGEAMSESGTREAEPQP